MSSGIRALQYVDVWLPQTQPWIFNQVHHLPANVESHVVCESTANLDQYHVPRIHALSELPPTRRFMDRVLRLVGVRSHLGFVRDVIDRLEPDLVHSHFGHVGWRNMGVVRDSGTPHVITFYGQDVSRLPASEPRWRRRYLDLFEAADLFLCEGPHMASRVEALGCPPGKIRVQRLGADLDRIPFRPRQWTPGERLRVLIAASFHEKKGIPYALEAVGRISGQVPSEVTVIGDATHQPRSGEEKRRILETVRANGLEEVVRFVGFQSHRSLLEHAYGHHLFLSPSVTAADGDTEGGAPVSLIEMAASGMPIVSTRHCDIPEVVLDGVNASLADERDVDGLVAGVHSLLDAHSEWPVRLQRGRAHVEARFDARAQGSALGERYLELVRGSATPGPGGDS